MTELQSLDLRGTKVTDEGVEKLEHSLPNYEIDHEPVSAFLIGC